MGKAFFEAFAEARETFQEVDETLKQKLSRLMFEGPEGDLTLTENAQPAIMACSMAVFRVLQKQGGLDLAAKARFVAGHSLGEYSALCAAGSLTLADTARLLKIRGQAMQKAVPVGQGAMAALLGLDIDVAEEVAREASTKGEICEAANDNAPGQVVISGHKAAVERAVEIAKEKGAKRALMLAVSAPFHSRLMQPAAEAMRAALAEAKVEKPVVPVVANVSAEPVSDPQAIRDSLVKQVTGRVRWRESMLFLKEAGIGEVVELGAGKVLTGLMKRIDKDVQAVSVEEPGEMDAVVNRL
jgi:[acyl-carrier-protein] S-malonyltransferase